MVLQEPPSGLSDYHLSQHLKTFLGGQRFATDQEMKTVVNNWLLSQQAEVYEGGIKKKLVVCYGICLNWQGTFVEK